MVQRTRIGIRWDSEMTSEVLPRLLILTVLVHERHATRTIDEGSSSDLQG